MALQKLRDDVEFFKCRSEESRCKNISFAPYKEIRASQILSFNLESCSLSSLCPRLRRTFSIFIYQRSPSRSLHFWRIQKKNLLCCNIVHLFSKKVFLLRDFIIKITRIMYFSHEQF